MFYAEDADATRAFLRDVLQLPHVDTGGGWLIFKTGPSEAAAHPSSWGEGEQAGGTDQRFDVSLMCDDLEATMTEIAGRGAEFDGGVEEQPWGHTVQVKVPGAGTVMLYEPSYPPVATADL